MKKVLIFILLFLGARLLQAQDITGQWNGMLEAGGQQLRIVFHIEHSKDGYTATMDSPDQGAYGMDVSGVTWENNKLKLVAEYPPIQYTGELRDSLIVGTFEQSGFEFPLDLRRAEIAKPTYNRPQEPQEPYPYFSEEVRFFNPVAEITLAGTLTLPDPSGVFPAVVLISGSGAQNRDEELMGHKPFKVLADHLTRHGFAVLRYDDRGFGESEGDFASGTTEDFATDAAAAVEYLRSRNDIGIIGLMGHSEGGIICPIVAAGNDDVKFIVLLAGTGVRGDRLLLMQEEAIMRASGSSEEEISKTLALSAQIYAKILQTADPEILKPELEAIFKESLAKGDIDVPEGLSPDDLISQQIAGIITPWMINFINYDPSLILDKVHCPVLAVNGDKDLQVPAEVNLAAIRAGLERGGNQNVTTIVFPGLNHLFQECETGAIEEYAKIEQTFSPKALEEITAWIRTQASYYMH